MPRMFYLIAAALLTPAMLQADSIRIGDRVYRDVYIRETRDFYYVYHPEEGRTERVSRRRSNVTHVEISEDEAYREQLMARYRAAKDSPPETAAPVTEVRKLDGELARHRQQMRDLAVFETQLAHWQGLSPETQLRIQEGLGETLVMRVESRASERERAVAQLQGLGETKVTVEQQLAAAARAREAAVQRARAEDDSDFYLRAYENSKGYVGPIYQYYYDSEDRLRTVPTWWYTEDPSLYNAAVTERARTRQRIGAAEKDYAARASTYGSALSTVEKAMTQRERDARAAVAKAVDEQRRFGSWQARVAALMEATDASYRPHLSAVPIAAWSGAAPQRTPDFSVGHGLWRIRCILLDESAAAGFAVTVYNADTDAPFTRIAAPDYLGMRSRIFDTPGKYYLLVEQRHTPVPYEIDVSALGIK